MSICSIAPVVISPASELGRSQAPIPRSWTGSVVVEGQALDRSRVGDAPHPDLELDPVRDAKLWAGIDRARRQLRRQPGNGELAWDQLQVEAVIDAVSGGEAGERVVELVVLIDEQTLRDGLHANSVCELSDGQPLPVSTVRQLACDAEIIPIVLNGHGRAMDVGRTATVSDTGPTAGVTGDAPNLHVPDLHRRLRRLPDPPHHPVGTGRDVGPRQSRPVV